jgi:hypothetical protein
VHRGASWKLTIEEQRDAIAEVLAENPKANYLLMYGSTPRVAALKAPQDNSPGQRPGSLNAVEEAPCMGAGVRNARSSSAPQLRRLPRNAMGLTPAAPSGRPEFYCPTNPGRCPGLVTFAPLARGRTRMKNLASVV